MNALQTTLRRTAVLSSRPTRRLATVAAAAPASAPLKIWVKGDPKTNTLADCPFCHRVLLHLEHKKIPYTKGYIDFANKPEWLQTVSGGKVPVIEYDGMQLPDSDKIVPYLEEKWPAAPMTTTAPAEVGGKLFPAFRGVLFSAEAELAAKQADLVKELQIIEDYLASKGGPLFGGAQLSASDAAIAPKLYHVIVALKHFKSWELPPQFKAIRKYMDAVTALPEWKATDYGKEMIIKGWTAHLASHH